MRRIRSSTSSPLAPETKRMKKTAHDIHSIFSQNGDNDAMMKSSNVGLAWMFVNKVNERHKRIAGSPKGHPAVSTVSTDDMVLLTEKFLDCQKCFRHSNSPNKVTLAYHYTNKGAMNSIKQNGLMTPAELCTGKQNGATYGDGIYTATNPFAFQDRYGEVGLLVAVIKGKTERVKTTPSSEISGETNTVIGNKFTDRSQVFFEPDSNQFFDEVVLLESSQCLPLVEFSSSLVSKTEDDSTGNNTIWAYHREMQRVVDTFFNEGSQTELHRIFPSMNIYIPVEPCKIKIIFQQFKCSSTKQIQYQTNNFKRHKRPRPTGSKPMPMYQTVPTTQPNTHTQLHKKEKHRGATVNHLQDVLRNNAKCSASLIKSLLHTYYKLNKNGHSPDVKDVLNYDAPETLNGGNSKCSYFDKDKFRPFVCPICMDQCNELNDDVVCLKVCSHQFHRCCINKALETVHRCPVCRKNIRDPQGPQPSGHMITFTTSDCCSGFEECGAICISYHLSNGVQKSYHDNPGQSYTGTRRCAYLPNNKEGRHLLERLKYAWMRGLIFRVGTSLTTGKRDSIVWSCIHHKTSPCGGPHGFPDERYVGSCHRELNSLGVPSSSDCTKRLLTMVSNNFLNSQFV